MIRYAEILRALLEAIDESARGQGMVAGGSAIEMRIRVYDTATSVVTDEMIVRKMVNGRADAE